MKAHLLAGTAPRTVPPYRPHPVLKKARQVESVQQMTQALHNVGVAAMATGVALKSVVEAINLQQIALAQRRAMRMG